MGRATSETSPTAAKAFLRSGVASFHLGRDKEAKNCFTEGQKLGEESGLKQWMSWCDEKIKKFGDFAPGVKPSPVDPKKDVNTEVVTPLSKLGVSEEVKSPSDNTTAAAAPTTDSS